MIGAIAATTRTLELGTAVTCPTMRMHPALVAQAAATCDQGGVMRFYEREIMSKLAGFQSGKGFAPG